MRWLASELNAIPSVKGVTGSHRGAPGGKSSGPKMRSSIRRNATKMRTSEIDLTLLSYVMLAANHDSTKDVRKDLK